MRLGLVARVGDGPVMNIVQARCPHCKNTLRIPADWLQKPMRCKHCKNVFQAKAREAGAAQAPAAPPKPSPVAPAPTVPATANTPAGWPVTVPPVDAAEETTWEQPAVAVPASYPAAANGPMPYAPPPAPAPVHGAHAGYAP